MPSEARHVCQRGAILLPFKHLSSNCIIGQYFILLLLTIEHFLIHISVEPSEAHVLKGCIQNCSIVKVYDKVLIINHVRMSDSMIALMGKNRNFLNICFTLQTPSRPLHSKKKI